jgi:tRNA dimethylallyltransferase
VKPRVPLVVLGPTASGKSDVAMAYAGSSSGVELLAVDAMQVYRRMDIGTAKPSAADRAVVPHHGVDLAEPSEEFTVAQFTRHATAALADISDRGKRAAIVAGTGLYLRAITDPMEIPGQWPTVRAELEARAGIGGPERLHAQLTALDPLAASRMEPTNTRRVVRALEVTIGGGRPFSSFGPGLDQHPPVPFVQIGLQWDRAALTERIARRVHAMMVNGLLAEVDALLHETGGLSRTAQQALGYKELIAHLRGECTLDEAVDTTILRTRQFAVRQERWFRRDPRVRWVHIEHDPVAEILPVLLSS